jgi:L-seryl-tRNA(Ser) seleniumtransferase
VTTLVRRELAAARARLIESPAHRIDDPLPTLRAAVEELRLSRIRGVINGTGVVVHTNLGRSPLAPAAIDALAEVARGYSNLEFDLSTGERGSRGLYVEQALATLCGAEAATVTNNCASGLVLALRHLVTPSRPHVVISRGELVQIGGGFRVPEILETSGALLREVGTTNQTTVTDYAKAVDDRTAMILQVHRSNFYMEGFVTSPSTADLAQLARERGVPLVHDLGSGHVAGLEGLPYIKDEPTPRDVLATGADLVVFSGDKLLGGPQAGIIAGRAGLIAGIKKQPLFRAMRCDKLVLAALQATVDLYLEGQTKGLPTLAMAAVPEDALRARAERLVAELAGAPLRAVVVVSEARMGGGSLPRTVLPSVALELTPQRGRVDDLAAALRRGTPPVVAHVASGAVRVDLRTVFPHQDEALLTAIRAAVGALEA